jgi:hypothetical protein
MSEIDRACLVEHDRASTAAVIGINELYPVLSRDSWPCVEGNPSHQNADNVHYVK